MVMSATIQIQIQMQKQIPYEQKEVMVMSAAIQMTEPEMSCDGCYRLIQVTMDIIQAFLERHTKANTHTYTCVQTNTNIFWKVLCCARYI